MATPVSFRFPDDDVDRWRAHADREGISFTGWAKRALDRESDICSVSPGETRERAAASVVQNDLAPTSAAKDALQSVVREKPLYSPPSYKP